MNWQEIKDKYPKAYKKFFKDVVGHHENLILLTDRNKRDLYDFFDENWICILISLTTDNVCVNWEYSIVTIPEEYFVEKIFFDTRPEAETAAFTKAFEILESKLKY